MWGEGGEKWAETTHQFFAFALLSECLEQAILNKITQFDN